jgi:hypothetical protein
MTTATVEPSPPLLPDAANEDDCEKEDCIPDDDDDDTE